MFLLSQPCFCLEEAEVNGDEFAALFESTSLIIVDEAHIAMAATYARVIKFGRVSRQKFTRLDTTPGRTEGVENSALADLFFGRASLEDRDPRRNNTIVPAAKRSCQCIPSNFGGWGRRAAASRGDQAARGRGL